jgi:hypothetical protein
MNNDAMTPELARQFLGDQVPGFGAVLAEALNLSPAALYKRIEAGYVSKTVALAALASLAVKLKQEVKAQRQKSEETRALSIADAAALQLIRVNGMRESDGFEFVLETAQFDDHLKACLSHLLWRGVVEDYVIDLVRDQVTLKMKEAQP